ncbi:MAG: DASS family sodium-coupled anion symporter [Pseudomonadota bacterium]
MSNELAQAQATFTAKFPWLGVLPGYATTQQRTLSKALAGFVLAWAVLFLILKWLPLPVGMTASGKATLAVMAWAAIIWIFEALPVAVSGLLIPMLLVLSNAIPGLPKAAAGFTSPVVFLCLVAFLFSSIMQAAGLDRRIALGILDKIKVKTVNGLIWAMFGVNLVLCFIVPAANARAATLLPVVNGLTGFFGNSEQERNAKKAIVIQTLVYGSMISGMCILTAHLPNLVLSGLFHSELKLDISYLTWLKLQWPYLGMFLLTQWWVQYYFRTRRLSLPGGQQAIQAEKAALPKAGKQDKSILLIFGLVAALWATEQWHKLPTDIVALLGLAAMFTPGLLHLKWKDIQDRTMWGTVFLLGGALSISSAISGTGLAQWLAAQIQAITQGHPWWGILLIVMLGTHVIRLGMLSNVAAVTMLAPVLLALAPKLGLHPVAFTMLVADTDSFAYILPTQITAAVIAYGSGAFTTEDYARVGVVSVLIAVAYGIIVMAPWYALLGLPLWNPAAPWPF